MEDTIKLAFNIGQALAKSKSLAKKLPFKSIKQIATTPIKNLTPKQKLIGGGLAVASGLGKAYGGVNLLESAGMRELFDTLAHSGEKSFNLATESPAFQKMVDKAQASMNQQSLKNITEGLGMIEAKKAPLTDALNKLELPKTLGKYFREATEQYRPGAEEMGYLRAKAQLHKAVKGFGGVTSLIPGPGWVAGLSSDLTNLAGQMDAANSIAKGKYLGIEEGYLKTLRDRVMGELTDSSKGSVTQLKENISKQLSELGDEALFRKQTVSEALGTKNPQDVKELLATFRDRVEETPLESLTNKFRGTTESNISGVRNLIDDIKSRAPKALQSKAEQYGITGKPLELARSLADEADMFTYTGLPPNVKSTIVEQIQERGTEQLSEAALQEIVTSAIKKGMGNEAGELLIKRLFKEGTEEAVKKTGKDIVGKLFGVALDSADAKDTGKLLDLLDGKQLRDFLKPEELQGLRENFQISTPYAVDQAIKDYGLAYNEQSLLDLADSIQKSKSGYGRALEEAASSGNQERVRQVVESNPRFSTFF